MDIKSHTLFSILIFVHWNCCLLIGMQDVDTNESKSMCDGSKVEFKRGNWCCEMNKSRLNRTFNKHLKNYLIFWLTPVNSGKILLVKENFFNHFFLKELKVFLWTLVSICLKIDKKISPPKFFLNKFNSYIMCGSKLTCLKVWKSVNFDPNTI